MNMAKALRICRRVEARRWQHPEEAAQLLFSLAQRVARKFQRVGWPMISEEWRRVLEWAIELEDQLSDDPLDNSGGWFRHLRAKSYEGPIHPG